MLKSKGKLIEYRRSDNMGDNQGEKVTFDRFLNLLTQMYMGQITKTNFDDKSLENIIRYLNERIMIEESRDSTRAKECAELEKILEDFHKLVRENAEGLRNGTIDKKAFVNQYKERILAKSGMRF